MVHAIFDKMVELSPYGNNTLEKLVGCVRYYFWDKAQAYFPASAYSKDAEWTYEDTWAAGLYKEVNPLQQSLGGHKEAEIDWVTMRMLFCAMYFNYGPFGAVNDSFSDTSTGQIAYGGAGAKTYLITMACDGNPTILRGQSELVTFGDRVKAGETIELTVPDSSGADTRIYIQGVDHMVDIGDLSDLQVSADNPQLSVASKRLQRLKIGDADASKVTTNVQALNFGECPSMIIVDARNAKSLTGTIDLSKMPRLMEAYFGGTGVKAVNVPNGSKIAVLELGEETTQISLMNLKFMELEGFRYSELPKLEFLRIENCSHLNPFTMLKSIYNTEGNVIRDIRIIGFDVDGDASDVTMIANLASDVDKDGNPHIYNGIDAEGKPMDNSHPIIEGRLRINGNIYEEDYQALKAVFANLAMEFLGFYVAIKDPEVLRVLLANITTDDGIGLTTEDIEGVTTISTWFKGNTEIETFDEFERFDKVTFLGTSTNQTSGGAFNGCTSLQSIKLPSSVTHLRPGAFYNCTSLRSAGDLSNIKQIGIAAFAGTLLEGEINLASAEGEIGYQSFAKTNITKILSLGNATIIGGSTQSTTGAFAECGLLQSVELPSTLTEIRNWAFYKCTSLSFDELNLPNLTFLGINAFNGVKIKKLNLAKLTSLPDGNGMINYGDKSVLEEVILSESLTTIPRSSFQSYTNLKKCVIPKSVVTISISAFDGATQLEGDVDLPNLTALGQIAFTNTKISSFSAPLLTTLPAQLNGLGAFGNCSNLNSINIPLVSIIPVCSFKNCSIGGALTLNATEIQDRAFYGNEIEELYLPSIISLRGSTHQAGTFAMNDKLRLVDMGEALELMVRSEFHGCASLVTFICRATTPPTLTYAISNILAGTPIASGNGVIAVPAASIPDYAAATNWSAYANRLAPLEDHEDGGYVPIADAAVLAVCVANWDTNGSGYMSKNECEAVTTIGTKFKGNTEISSFDELESFTNVTSLVDAFTGCTGLTRVNLKNITSISRTTSDGSFYNTALTKAIMPNIVTLGNWAFRQSTVELAFAGAYCSTISTWAFNNTPLHTFVCAATTPPSLTNTNAFPSSAMIYVPDESLAAYQSASNWSTFASRIKGISQLATDNPTFYAEIQQYL
jgi:hypothetical protein